MDKYIAQARGVIESIGYATLATVTPEGMPWNSPVRHVYDADLNIYWFSDKQSQHSQNVRANGEVYVVIYNSTVPEGQGLGIYIQATAVEVVDPGEVLRARRLKKGAAYQAMPGEFLGDESRRVYKAVPRAVWLNGAEVTDGVFIRDYRRELQLEALKEVLREEK
jgi:nitroimidazol reductase NimA-like FMN-containing flavoprotein (pyridoxamine 5'-phosphate oxidase superfamily)